MMKKTQGRKKIEMKKIPKTTNLQVTFSKRRAGLFKKASELCVLTGAEAAVIVQSPGNRVYAFGHPSVDSVVDKYVAGSSSMPEQKPAINEVDVNSACVIDKFNQEYIEITKKIEEEKRKNVDVVKKETDDGPFWWEQPIKDLGEEELEEYIASMEVLRNKVIARANDMHMIRNSSMFNVDDESSKKVDKLLVTRNAAASRKEHGGQSPSSI
ncbi:agamous-like MADS-box protein AGL62 [Heracleum sosnowskyi]|uniref:Agamous-like MADS-box protein AGL62 n=1 Tax=Heracleum sosnowskyi TaxID=360622 RepID=A0AAD8HMR9_9APIA|nr:agamous-like MADS-box protein AGL62 [Heracleum sosnowskyi]